MGKVLSVVQRRINRYNVEARAHKIISKDKPTPAPMYSSTKEQLEKFRKDYPEIVEQHSKKDQNLEIRLKDVYVTSQDPEVNPDKLNKKSEVQALLPQERQTPEDPEFGYYEPTMIPYGRITLRQALKFIMDHQTEPTLWTAESIANKYNLSCKVTEDILNHFRAFDVYMPEIRDKKIVIAEPAKKSIPAESEKTH